MCPATPSSKPYFENRRKAAARRSLRWRRSSSTLVNSGGVGMRSGLYSGWVISSSSSGAHNGNRISRKDAINHRLEMLKRQRVVSGVERSLIPLVGESAGQRVPGLCGVPAAGFRVHPHQRVIMPPLKILMRADDLVSFARDVRSEDFSRNRGVIGDRDHFADVVTERGDDQFLRS